MKFLVVDDSKLMRNMIDNMIKRYVGNVEIFHAEDGVHALKILEENEGIRYMFSDWNMPNMNGLDLVKSVKSKRDHAHMKIIMVTTEGEKSRVIEAAKAGVDGYMVKPFNPESIEKVLHKLIAD